METPVLHPNAIVRLEPRNLAEPSPYTVIAVLREQDKAGWWTAGVVASDHPSYPVQGYDLSIHPDDMVKLDVTLETFAQ